MSKVGLVIIFNHKYNNNIPKLQRIYEKRFSEIAYIVPFFDEYENFKEYNIISVYDSSYSFEGYIAQAENVLKKMKVDHYIFIGDDLIINPLINENNYMDFFGIKLNESFTTEICKINEKFGRYGWTIDRVNENLNRFKKNRFVNALEELPPATEAFEIAKKKGYVDFSLTKSFYRRTEGMKGIISYFRTKLPKQAEYPIFGGYSDINVISKKDFNQYAHYCGVFSAMGIFVEIAIPTAMILACEKIVQEKDLVYQRGDMWGMGNKDEFAKKYNYSVKTLEEKWDKEMLFAHPIKLSQWSLN